VAILKHFKEDVELQSAPGADRVQQFMEEHSDLGLVPVTIRNVQDVIYNEIRKKPQNRIKLD